MRAGVRARPRRRPVLLGGLPPARPSPPRRDAAPRRGAAVTKLVVRGWLRFDRERFASDCRERGLRGDDRRLLMELFIEADDRTGAIEGDLGAIAAEVLDMSRSTLWRRLPPLERAGAVLVERSHATGEGRILIVDYA